MTNEEAKKMLKAKLECLKRETSGTDIDCNYRNCDECNLCYEQGNMGEQKEVLDMAIEALEQTELEPSYNSIKTELDCISREAVLDIINNPLNIRLDEIIKKLPLVTPQRKRGKWLWELASNGWANHICSECGFKENTDIHVKLNWRYCPKCGAEMIESEK